MKKIILLTLLSASVFAKTKCVAHRGFKGGSLENSMRAIKTAFKVGADAIEFDVRQTKDGVPLLMHDARIVRTGRSKKGKNCDLVFKRVKAINYAHIKENCELKNGEEIPTLEDVLKYLSQRDVEAFVELKQKPNRKIAELINQYYSNQLGKIKLLSKSARIYKKLAELDDFNNTEKIDFFKTDFIPFKKKKPYNASYWFVGDKITSFKKYDESRQIYVWTIDNEKIMKQYFKKGVDYIASNQVNHCLKARDQWEQQDQ